MGKRGRAKLRKDFAIKLIHPEMGDFYFHYSNRIYNNSNRIYNNSNRIYNNYTFYFTQNLNKVNTWKTSKYAETQIKQISEYLQNKNAKILLEFGEEPNEEMKKKLTVSRKKYYFTINSVISKIHFEEAKNNINKLNETLINDSKMITKLIRKCKHVEKDFLKIVNKLTNDINLYRKDHSFLEKNKDSEPIFLDVVDASYGFRLLKLRTLKKVQIEDEIKS